MRNIVYIRNPIPTLPPEVRLKQVLKIISSLFSDVSKFTAPALEQGQFVRMEDKYLLTKEQADALVPLLKTHLNNASPIPNTDYTIIESVYFDNSELNVLKEYLAQNTSRSKMRTRRYAPNGVWGQDIFIEGKQYRVIKQSAISVYENVGD